MIIPSINRFGLSSSKNECVDLSHKDEITQYKNDDNKINNFSLNVFTGGTNNVSGYFRNKYTKRKRVF